MIAILTEALMATHVYPNYVTLHASLFVSPELGIYYASASLVNEGKPQTPMTKCLRGV